MAGTRSLLVPARDLWRPPDAFPPRRDLISLRPSFRHRRAMTEITREQLHAYLDDALSEPETCPRRAGPARLRRPAPPTPAGDAGPRPGRPLARRRSGGAMPHLPHPRDARQFPAPGPRRRRAGLPRLPPEDRRLPLLPRQPRRPAGPAAARPSPRPASAAGASSRPAPASSSPARADSGRGLRPVPPAGVTFVRLREPRPRAARLDESAQGPLACASARSGSCCRTSLTSQRSSGLTYIRVSPSAAGSPSAPESTSPAPPRAPEGDVGPVRRLLVRRAADQAAAVGLGSAPPASSAIVGARSTEAVSVPTCRPGRQPAPAKISGTWTTSACSEPAGPITPCSPSDCPASPVSTTSTSSGMPSSSWPSKMSTWLMAAA